MIFWNKSVVLSQLHQLMQSQIATICPSIQSVLSQAQFQVLFSISKPVVAAVEH